MLKAQAGIEYLFLVSVMLVLLTPIFIYSTQLATVTIRTTQAKDAVATLAEAAETVYRMGGGRIAVFITIPDGIVNYTIANRTIRLTTVVGSGYGHVFELFPANITGEIPTIPGRYKIFVEMLPTNLILIESEDITPPIILGVSPSGTISNTMPRLKATTHENALCKYCPSLSCDEFTSYATMTLSMNGNETGHYVDVGPLDNATYTYYVRCADYAGNKMTKSAKIEFTVNTSEPDTTPPSVSNTAVNATDVFVNEYVCVSARATDINGVSVVWIQITNPFGNATNYTLSDILVEGDCAGSVGDDIYGASLQLQAVGNYTVNTAFATDPSGNLGFESPYPNIIITVRTKPGITVGDIGLDNAWHFRTDDGIADQDGAAMKSWIEITPDFKDSNANTPPSTGIIKRLGNDYLGYVVFINNDSSFFSVVEIAVFTTSIAVDPYPLRIYVYTSLTDINASAFKDFTLTSANLNVWTNIDVTNITATEAGKGWMRLRITTQPTITNNKAAHFSEAKYRGG